MIRVTIFEDYADMRHILSSLVESSDAFQFAGAYPNAMDVLNVVKKTKTRRGIDGLTNAWPIGH